MLNRVIILVHLLCLARTQQTIAIVGCGAGGAAAAHFLRDQQVTVFEQGDHCGGRVQHYDFHGIREVGAHFFIDENRYVKHLAQLAGVNIVKAQGSSPVISFVDSQYSPLFQTSSYELLTMAKMLWRYGLDPVRMDSIQKQALRNFQRIYDHLDSGDHFRDYDEFLRLIQLQNDVKFKDYLQGQGIGSAYLDEFVQAVIMNIYNQDFADMNLVAGMISMIAAYHETYKVQGGNNQIFNRIAADIDVRFNSPVHRITKVGSKHALLVNGTTQLFDKVIIATALHNNTSIQFGNQDIESLKHKYRYQNTYVTFIKGTIKTLENQDQHKIAKSAALSQCAGIATKGGDPLNLYSFRKNGFMLESQQKLQLEDLNEVFEGAEVVHKVDWEPAYPKLTVENPSNIELEDGLYYLNSMEQLASCMEMEMISAKNIANMIRSKSVKEQKGKVDL